MKPAAAAAVLLLAGCREKPPGPSGPAPAAPAVSASASVAITGLTAARSGAHLHLTVSAKVKNTGSAPLVMAPPAVQFRAGSRPVPPFIAPGLDPAAVAPGGESSADTHWWLAAADLVGPLELDVAGARVSVKSAAPFALESLSENKPVTLTFPDWK